MSFWQRGKLCLGVMLCGVVGACGAQATAPASLEDPHTAGDPHTASAEATLADTNGTLATGDPKATPTRKTPHNRQGIRRRPSLRETRAIGELMSAAERVRRLKFARPVPVWVENRDRITDYVGTQIEEDELERARVVYTALGLLSPDLDVRALLLRLLGEQVVGYYDADAKHLVVRDDIMRGFAAKPAGAATSDTEAPDELADARIVLLHELVHALQDQRLGLSTHIHEERDTDASNAFHALVEGDATLAMIGYALEREQIPLQRLTSNGNRVRMFSDVVLRSPLAGSELQQAPAIVRVPLLSSYVDGLAFCATLHGHGGFDRVDRAHTAPPSTTEQILHPERFTGPTGPDQPTAIRLPTLRELDQAGYQVVREDTLGELEMSVYFSQANDPEQTKQAAEGWDGDRIRVYRAPHQPALVLWVSVWDSERDAQEAQVAAERVRSRGDKASQLRSSVYRRGARLLLFREFPPELQSSLSQLLLATH
jgi:hypothetical protein